MVGKAHLLAPVHPRRGGSICGSTAWYAVESLDLEVALDNPASALAAPEDVAALDGLIGDADIGNSAPTRQRAILRRRGGRG